MSIKVAAKSLDTAAVGNIDHNPSSVTASDITEINEARKQLFAHKGRTLENIPPTQALSSSTSSVPASATRPASGASH